MNKDGLASGGAHERAARLIARARKLVGMSVEDAAVYGVTSDELLPPRTPLIADQEAGTLRIGDRETTVGADGDPLASYLAMIYAARGVPSGQKISLRDEDIDVLVGLVGDDASEVESRLIELMHFTPEDARSLRALLFRRRALASAASVALGLVSLMAVTNQSGPTRHQGRAASSHQEQRYVDDVAGTSDPAGPTSSTDQDKG